MQEAQDHAVEYIGLTFSDRPYCVIGRLDGERAVLDVYAYSQYGEIISTPVSRCYVEPEKQSMLTVVDRFCHVIAKGLLTIYESRDMVYTASDLKRRLKLEGRTVVRYV